MRKIKHMAQLPQRKATRLREYNYSTPGYYFVTICTYNRTEKFGMINNEEMKLNKFGKIVKSIWEDIPIHFKNTELDEYTIMPNHIHGILIVNDFVGNGPRGAGLKPGNSSNSTGHARSGNKKGKNLSVIIGSFKSAVSLRINKLNEISFKWQRSFYDHIIRIDESLNKIRKYIVNNAGKWDEDENNIKNYDATVQACLNPTKPEGKL